MPSILVLQISHLVCSLAGQRCSKAWGTFWTWIGQSITALIAWRKEEWRKKAADIPPSKVENDLCSTRQILALFQGQPLERRDRVHMGLSEHNDAEIETGAAMKWHASYAQWNMSKLWGDFFSIQGESMLLLFFLLFLYLIIIRYITISIIIIIISIDPLSQ